MGEPDATPPPRPLLSRPSRRYSRADAGSSGRARNESSIAAIKANRLSFVGGPLVSESGRTLRGGASGTAPGPRGAAPSRGHATPGVALTPASTPPGRGGGGHGVHDPGAPVLLGQPVAVGHEGAAAGDLDFGLARVERDPQVFGEEVAAPAIVVAAHQRDRHVARPDTLELRHRAEMTSR